MRRVVFPIATEYQPRNKFKNMLLSTGKNETTMKSVIIKIYSNQIDHSYSGGNNLKGVDNLTMSKIAQYKCEVS